MEEKNSFFELRISAKPDYINHLRRGHYQTNSTKMDPRGHAEFVMFVTHVEADGRFLRIWGQTDKSSATSIERVINPLAETFARREACHSVNPNIRVDAMCCTKFQTEGYYRAKVLNLRPDGLIEILFIDYGNRDVVRPYEVHILDNYVGTESLQSIPPLAKSFILANVISSDETWAPNSIEYIRKTLCYNECKVFYRRLFHLPLIKLMYNDDNVGEILVNNNLVSEISVEDMLGFPREGIQTPQVPVQLVKAPANENLVASPPQIQHFSNVYVPPHRKNITPKYNPIAEIVREVPLPKPHPPPAVQEALVFKSRILSVGGTYNVYVSFVEDGPYKFSVQDQGNSKELEELMNHINKHPCEPLREPPITGSVCLGRYSADKVLCRAVVMSVMDKTCKVYYVDFGHTEVLEYTDIYQLPPEYIHPKVLSIRFTLSGIQDLDVSQDMKDFFKMIVSGKSLALRVNEPEGPPLMQYGDLFCDGKNLRELLKEAFPGSTVVTYHVPVQLTAGVEEMVWVSYVESCQKFWVQLDKQVESLESLMARLGESASISPPLDPKKVMVGLPCAALYETQWYRAIILSINKDQAKVLYIDYGNEETVGIDSLRTISHSLINELPVQAMICILNGYENTPPNQAVNEEFEKLTIEKRMYMKVNNVLATTLLVDLYDPETSASINTKLVGLQSQQEISSNNISQHTNDVLAKKNFESQNTNNRNQAPEANVWEERQNNNSFNEKPKENSWRNESNQDEKPKENSWRNEPNQDKRSDNRYEKFNNNRDDSKRDRFDQDDSRKKFDRNDRFEKNDQSDRDGFKNKFDRSNSYEKNDYKRDRDGFQNKYSKEDSQDRNDRSGRDGYKSRFREDSGESNFQNNDRRPPRGGRDRFSPSDSKPQDRSFSDKDRGESGNRYTNNNRESSYGKPQTEKWGDNNSRSNTKTGNFKNESNNRTQFGQGNNSHQDSVGQSNDCWDDGQTVEIPASNKISIAPITIALGTTHRCEVVFATSPTDFFIQLMPACLELDPIMESIMSTYDQGGECLESSKILPNVYCIAQYTEDLKWYRALIKSVESTNATVEFIDYGNVEIVEFGKIKTLQKEFSELAMQAVHCKLMGTTKTDWNQEEIQEIENLMGKSLEIEFVTEENRLYQVLLREVVDDTPVESYINQKFSGDNDLMKMKERLLKMTSTDYVSSDEKWLTASLQLGSKHDVVVTWFTDPKNFYCQILDEKMSFQNMMNEIQKTYAKEKPLTSTLKVGSPIVALYASDGALYRAEIIELNKQQGHHIVQFIDFGNNALVNQRNIYPLMQKFTLLPKQAVNCCLKNIRPVTGDQWPKENTKQIDKCFDADKFECTLVEYKDEKYMISLTSDGKDITDKLVEQNLAIYDEGAQSTPSEDDGVERVDISLLNGHAFRTKVSSVESGIKFYIELPTAEKSEKIINEYMSEQNPEVMPRLSLYELCLGAGCLIYSNGTWGRAVVVNCLQSETFHVRLIDSGACEIVHLDRMLKLPTPLSIMQNQSVECSLQIESSNSEIDGKLKELVEGKQVIVKVEEVDNNRLLVKLYDLQGVRLAITSEEVEDTVAPICPLQILSSTHQVLVSFANHSGSIWLQRQSDYEKDVALIQSLQEHYSTAGNLIVPEENLLCVAMSGDGNWYRAKVIKRSETTTFVNFIDIGHVEEVTLDSIKELDSKFYTPYQLAVEVSLSVSLQGSEQEQVMILQNHLSSKALKAIFYNVSNKWIVELFDGEEKMSDKFRSLGLVKEVVKSVSSSKTENMFEVVISHVDTPSQFWFQHMDEIDLLNDKQAELQTAVEGFPATKGIPEEGTLCATIYSIDSMWYRAEVLDADEDIITVRFIDYGNTDVIDNKSSNIKQIVDGEWKTLKRFATQSKLDVIPLNTEDWSEAACTRFSGIVLEAESLQALVIKHNKPNRVKLFLKDKSIGDILVEEQYANLITNEEESIDEIVDVELDPHSAFVSHTNSPSEFWVQEEKSVANLEVMTDRCLLANMFPEIEEIKEGLLCVAKFPDDEQWYRAKVITHDDNGTQVIFIDYGNSAVSTEIREIPQDLADIPHLSRKCCLVLPIGVEEWSEEACNKFIDLAAEGQTIFILDIIKEEETSMVNLTLNGENVTDILGALCSKKVIIEERLTPLGEENLPTGVISQINSLDEFWIQPEQLMGELEVMPTRLADAASFLSIDTVEVGIICAAIYPEDEQWYRAKVLSCDESQIEVLYIDYGNSAITTELRILPEDVINIPVLSKRCTLMKPNHIQAWSEEANSKFVELVADEVNRFEFQIIDDEDPLHVNLNINGINILDTLAPSPVESSTTGTNEQQIKQPCSDAVEPVTSKIDETVEITRVEEIEKTCSDAVEERVADVEDPTKEIEEIQESCGDVVGEGVSNQIDETVEIMKVEEIEQPCSDAVEEPVADGITNVEDPTKEIEEIQECVSNQIDETTVEMLNVEDSNENLAPTEPIEEIQESFSDAVEEAVSNQTDETVEIMKVEEIEQSCSDAVEEPVSNQIEETVEITNVEEIEEPVSNTIDETVEISNVKDSDLAAKEPIEEIFSDAVEELVSNQTDETVEMMKVEKTDRPCSDAIEEPGYNEIDETVEITNPAEPIEEIEEVCNDAVEEGIDIDQSVEEPVEITTLEETITNVVSMEVSLVEPVEIVKDDIKNESIESCDKDDELVEETNQIEDDKNLDDDSKTASRDKQLDIEVAENITNESSIENITPTNEKLDTNELLNLSDSKICSVNENILQESEESSISTDHETIAESRIDVKTEKNDKPETTRIVDATTNTNDDISIENQKAQIPETITEARIKAKSPSFVDAVTNTSDDILNNIVEEHATNQRCETKPQQVENQISSEKSQSSCKTDHVPEVLPCEDKNSLSFKLESPLTPEVETSSKVDEQ